jgi:hypothetical protein
MDVSSVRYGAQIVAAATAHNIDPQLLAAVAAQETGGPGSSSGNNIVGDGGHGHGVFQIDDRTWGFAKTSAAMDPAQNANFAAGILADNLQRYGGNVKMALSAYNAGSPTATGTTTTWANGKTLGYADSVLQHYTELGGTATAAATAATAAELTANSGDNLASVNQLANAFATYANGTAGTTTAAPSASAVNAAAIQPPEDSSENSLLTPLHSYSQLDSAAQQTGSSADQAMADIVDSSDVYDNGSDD